MQVPTLPLSADESFMYKRVMLRAEGRPPLCFLERTSLWGGYPTVDAHLSTATNEETTLHWAHGSAHERMLTHGGEA